MKPLSDAAIASLTARLEQEDDFVFLESARVSKENHCSLLFTRPCGRLLCMAGDDAAAFLARADSLRSRGYFVAGWFSYEFGYLLEPRLRHLQVTQGRDGKKPLAVLTVYNEPLIFNHKTSRFSGDREWPSAVAEAGQSFCRCMRLQPTISREQYLEALQKIQEYICAGDTYQVNFTLHLDFQYQGTAASLYQTLRRNQSVSYGAWIRYNGRDILSFSPELFFAADPAGVRVRPMKGTMARGRTTAEDAQRKEQLCSDPKNRSENVMIVDLLRNDLGRLLHAGGGGRVVPRSLFDVETYESLLQMTSTIDGIPEGDAPLSLVRLMSALFPCGSVTGAPKIRTMEIIHELETQARGVYCGAIGYAGPEQSCFNVPIRTLELSEGHGRMGIGSGIVADSGPDSEWQECLLKGNFLTASEPGFQLIETLLWQPDKGFYLLEFHLERLADSGRYFHFQCDLEAVRSRLLAAVAESTNRQRVRLLLHRDGRIEIAAVSLADEPPALAPRKAIFSSTQVDPHNPHLFHKTTRRHLFDQERSRAVERNCFEVLFTNTLGQVTEGAISNIFIRRKGQLLTPPVSCGLLAGTFRRMLLEQGRAIEQVLTVEDVLATDEVYVANSVRGLVRIRLEED